MTASEPSLEGLRESDLRLFTLLSNLPGMAYRCLNDSHWTMEFVSEGCRALTGYDSTELVGNVKVSYADLIHPDDRQTVWSQVQSSVTRRQAFQLEYRIRTAEGREKWVWEQGSPILNDDGTTAALEGFITDITDRKQAEEALRVSEARYRRLYQNMSDAFASVTMEGRIAEYNDAFREMLGYRPDELLNLSYADITPEEWLATEAEIVETQVLRRGFSETYEKQYRRKDGTIVPVELRTVLTRNDQGQPVGMWAIIRDITGRKRSAELLKQAHDDLERQFEERTAELTDFRRFAESSSQGFGMSDLEGRITYANSTMCRLLGEDKPEDVVGKVASEYYPAEMQEQWLKTMRLALDRSDHWEDEVTILSRQGRRIPTLHHFFVLRDEQGLPVRRCVVVTDITEQKKAREALEISERRYRMLVEACPDAVVLADPQMRLVFASPQAVRLYGAGNEDEMRGLPLVDFVVEEERHRVHEGMARFFEKGILRAVEYTFQRKDGSRFPCELSSAIIRDEQNQPVAIISIVRDITDRKKTQDALEQERQSLWRMLQSSDHERQIIAYEIHDGLTQYLAAATMQFDAYEALRGSAPDKAHKAYATAVELVRQSHFESRRLISQVRPPVIDENGLEMALAHLVHEQRRQGHPIIEYQASVQFKRLSPILENALYRIAQEALNNACKHSHSKRIAVKLLQNGPNACLEVQDWGCGFDVARVEKGKFGLEGIRQRVRLLAGTLTIESVPDRGTRVCVAVPIAEDAS